MDPKKQFYETLATSMIENFKKRQIDAYYCATKEEAVALATSMLPSQATVGFGGSMTLIESGMMAALQNKTDITLYDRSKAATPEETTAIYHQCLNADYYFMSSNAITSDGQLVNIDGNGNRVAALIYGPKEVIVMAGMNKVVKQLTTLLTGYIILLLLPTASALARKRHVHSPEHVPTASHRNVSAIRLLSPEEVVFREELK